MSQLNPSEISSVLKEKIAGLDLSAERKNEGIVVSVSDGIVRIHGMGDVMYGEVIEFENGTKGMALNLEQDSVGAVVLGDYLEIIEGQKAVCTGKVLEVPVGEAMLGRVVNTLGAPIDGKGEINAEHSSPVEVVAPGVIARQSVDQPVQIGLKAVDAMVPIGRGQRELIIGDRQTGKTAVAIDAIINQKGTGIKCIYVAIGQKQSTVANVVRKLEEYGAMEHTIVVSATAADPAPMQYLSAYAGCTMREYFPYKVMRVEEAEADDIIAVLTQEEMKNPTTIISSDKDFIQLQKYEGVQQWSPLTKSFVKGNPEESLWEKLIKGDVGDGVPNILSSDDTLVTEGKRQRPVSKKKMELWKTDRSDWNEDMKRNFNRNEMMVDLEKTPESIRINIINQFREQVPPHGRLMEYFTEKRLKNLMEHLDEF